MNPASDCRIRHGDGQNEVGLVTSSAIDGNLGLAVLQLGACFIGSNDIDEVDVMIANEQGFTPQPGDFLGTDGRGTFIHEFGHLFGFLHEDTHAVMRTSPPDLLTGGSEPSTVWPSDTIGMREVYGFSTTGPNLLPSALGVVGGSVQTLDPASTVALCRDTTGTTRVYLGNSGNAASGTYNLRIRLSPTPPMSGYFEGSDVAAEFTHSLGAFSEGTFDLPFSVPSSLPDDAYFIYVDMDHTGTIGEILEGDNSTVSAMRIQVSC